MSDATDKTRRLEDIKGALNAHRQGWMTYTSAELERMQDERRELESESKAA